MGYRQVSTKVVIYSHRYHHYGIFFFMSNAAYQQKLKSPNWQRKRLEILQRDNFTCKLCGDTEQSLHVHHEKYDGDPWNIPNEHLTTLCSDCHSITHELEEYKIKKVGKDPIAEEMCVYAYAYCEKTVSVLMMFLGEKPLLHVTYPIHIIDRIYLNKP